MRMLSSATAEGRTSVDHRSLWARIDEMDLARAVFVTGCTVVTWSGSRWWPRPVAVAVALVGLAVGCWPILVEAWEDLRHRRMSMELSMLIAIVGAAVIGEWVTALVIAVFVLAAEILEDLSMDRGRDALTDLMTFLPDTVQVRHGQDGDGVRTVPSEAVRPGQVVVVGPGGRIPVDGTVVAGHSTADQSRITGESLPVDLGPGDAVFAGSINQVGAVEIRTERVGTDSSYGRIVEAVQHAQESEAPAQRLADRLAAYLVYVALAGAAVCYLVTRDLTATISVVVVAGACGIAAGTPLAVLAAIARTARSGAFVKDGAHLEALSAVDTIMFDKTGTLTTGTPTVVDVRPVSGIAEDELLRLTAAAESYSEHPLGQAIVAHAVNRQLAVAAPASFDYKPGLGVHAQVDGREVAAGNRALVADSPVTVEDQGTATAVHVSVDGRYAGSILLADPVRESAPRAMSELRRRGLRLLMITGDQEPTARAVATELDMPDVRAGLLPHDKLDAIDAERTAGHRLAMVGDGMNDAPALARADVGIAMGGGTDIARESADIVLISSDLGDLAYTVHVARRARRIVMANFGGTLVVDLFGMALAAAGVLGPVPAALVHVGSETAFILNSARLIPGRRSRDHWPERTHDRHDRAIRRALPRCRRPGSPWDRGRRPRG